MASDQLNSLIHEKIEQISFSLMRHENKNNCLIPSMSNNQEIKMKNRIFYLVQTNVFKQLITDGEFINVRNENPDKFGTGNAMDVLEALKQSDSNFILESLDRYISYINNEKFAYVIELSEDGISEKVLRIDLFRKLDDENGNKVFTGGLFHVLKHFSITEQEPLSINQQGYVAPYWDYIVNKIITNFFFEELKQHSEHKNKYLATSRLDDNHCLFSVYYYNSDAQVYFVDTLYVK